MKFIETYSIFEIKLENTIEQKAFEYINKIYQKFMSIGTEWISRNDLRLVDLGKEYHMKTELQSFLIKMELIRNGEMYKLKFPNKEPTLLDIKEYIIRYRKINNASQQMRYNNLNVDKKLELNKKKYQNMILKLEPGKKLDTNKWYKNLSDEDKKEYLQKKRDKRNKNK